MINNSSRDIRKLVYDTGLSILDLAIEINASEKSIYKWMNGTSRPNCSHLLALLNLAKAAEGADEVRGQ